MSHNPLRIDDLLRFMVQQKASDLHIKPMRPPLVRLGGKLLPLKIEPLKPDVINALLDAIVPEPLRATLESQQAIDFGYSLAGLSRFRASVFQQRGTRSAVFRRVPFDFPTLEDWGLPAVLSSFATLPQGLVLITGPTGSGKSSTLAALMRLISSSRLVHIVTVEDPIEFLLSDGVGAVTQREVGTDTPSFAHALRNVLRQDPDVIMVGEMRDATTMQTVLTAAETGHLVFSTVHTNSAVQTIDRIVDSFPEGNHRQIRQQLSTVLQAVVSMKLVERMDGSGLVAAIEIMIRTPRVSKLIFEGNLEALEEEIENSVAYHKMQSMNQSLAALVVNRQISLEAALGSSTNPGDLDLILRKLLYAAGAKDASPDAPQEDGAMAEPLSDFSKILELQEIKKAYEEQEERHRGELAEREAEIARLEQQARAQQSEGSGVSEEVARVQAEHDRLAQQLQLVRQEYEAKIERLNARIRELSGSAQRPEKAAAAGDAERRGFFRR
jgi:twitching motility protein PilT